MKLQYKDNKGNMLLALIFVVLITFMGLSLLSFSIFHTWIRSARTQKITETGRMHQELIYYLHNFREDIFNEDLRAFTEPEIDYFNKDHFPDTPGHGSDNIIIKNSFTHRIFPREFYKKIRVADSIDVSCTGNNYGIRAEVFIDMLSGQIPLTFFPFFLDKSIDLPEDIFMEQNNVKVADTTSPHMVIDDMEVEFNSSEFLLNCLDIKGTAITWAAMREKFGFEVSDDPIPEGIHLLVEEGMVKVIFIQGDVDRLVFSAAENVQKILVVKNGIPHEYHYKPGENYFISRDNQRQEEWLFMERIAVNGNIWSVEQEGDAAFTETSNITLFASGTVVIRSDLETENFDLEKMKSTSLTLVVSGSEKLFNREDLKPGVTVEKEDETSIQASIVTDGKVVNKSSKLKVKGSIFCKDLENQGSIEIGHRNSNADCDSFFRTTDYKYIYHFHINLIEEVLG
jgi:hypothetical protein